MVINGDCLHLLKVYPDNFFDSIVTDPPYHLVANSRNGSAQPGDNLTPYGRSGPSKTKGFMGQEWDGGDVAFRVELWRECLRVLKPGGHLLAFSGSRTYHRMTCAIEDAGFEIRDQIMWIYGSGFPKSHNGPWGGTALKPGHEPICMARKPLIGTVEHNFQKYGTGSLNIEDCRVGDEDTRSLASKSALGLINDDSWQAREVMAGSANGRWPANVIHDGSSEVLAAFPQAKGQIAKASTGSDRKKTQNVYSDMSRGSNGQNPRPDSGSAARFFYCAKASKSDRGEGNIHPTVKPTELMRYLCRLVTPPGGHVLDPFTGSGSTWKAAKLEKFEFTGFELSAEYCEIARSRVEGV